MLLEGLKLMVVGMSTVMLFLLLMIVCIEWVKFLTRNFTLNQQQTLQDKRKSDLMTHKSTQSFDVPIEVFAAAIASYESANNTS